MEKKNIDKEVEQTLLSLDGLEKAEPSGLFYEKVLMRMENKEAKIISLTSRVIWQTAACIAVLITLNVLVCVRFSKSDNAVQAQKNPVAEEYFSYLRTAQF